MAQHPHPTSTSVLESTDDSTNAPGWATPMSTKSAGKQKETTASGKEDKPLDTKSEALFPGLGGAPKAYTTPVWAKKATSNGNSTPTNGSSAPRSSAPPTGNSRASGAQSLAGQVTGTVYTFGPKDLPRSATRKPLPEVLRDINKKYRANLSQTTGEGGVVKISSTGTQVPESVKRQAFKELGTQILTKVISCFYSLVIFTESKLVIAQSFHSKIRKSAYHWERRIDHQVHPREFRSTNSTTQNRRDILAGR